MPKKEEKKDAKAKTPETNENVSEDKTKEIEDARPFRCPGCNKLITLKDLKKISLRPIKEACPHCRIVVRAEKQEYGNAGEYSLDDVPGAIKPYTVSDERKEERERIKKNREIAKRVKGK